MKLTTKRNIAVLSVALALVGGVASMPAASATTTPSRYVTITADGSVKVVPDAVQGEKDAADEDGNPVYQGIDTSYLVATLTAAIQEQQALITTLTARITALETT